MAVQEKRQRQEGIKEEPIGNLLRPESLRVRNAVKAELSHRAGIAVTTSGDRLLMLRRRKICPVMGQFF